MNSKRKSEEYFDRIRCPDCKKKHKRPFIRIDYQETEILNLRQYVKYLIEDKNKLISEVQK